MSGSGSSSFGGGGDGFSSDCATLVINTQISSPKMGVVSLLSVGDVLDVDVQRFNGVSVVAVTHGGNIAGGVASPQVQRLRECIDKGVQYRATVIAINGPQVNIKIENQ